MNRLTYLQSRAGQMRYGKDVLFLNCIEYVYRIGCFVLTVQLGFESLYQCFLKMIHFQVCLQRSQGFKMVISPKKFI